MNKTDFLKAIETLKLYRRAELIDEDGKRLIKQLYVDPLPDEHVLKTILRPNTTFLIGRKGTGKSTIFQMAQEELDTTSYATWAYIDIKTLFESATADFVGIPQQNIGALDAHALKRIHIFRSFVLELVKAIRAQVGNRISTSLIAKIKDAFSGSSAELFENLDELIQELKQDDFINASLLKLATESEQASTASSSKQSGGIKAEATESGLGGSIHGALQSTKESGSIRTHNYSQVYLRVFKISQLIQRLCDILSKLGLRHLYIFVDDFSELPETDMEEVVDTILAPFNNWSNEFIKLKVAVYPGRMYTGDIDRSKVDEIYLDIYRAYGRNDVTGMEKKAIEFTERLLRKRFEHFCHGGLEDYIDISDSEIWRTLFFASLGNPRILGYILYYCYETNIIYDRRITVRTIQDASRRYYEEKLNYYFKLNKFLQETFEERSSIYSLRELFEQIVIRAKELRSYSQSEMMSGIKGRRPTSHFHILAQYDSVLSTLELNFFITKYYEMKDRDGREVSVYALNYGLCQQQSIAFGRPEGKREYRLYFVERIFDYSPIITSYLKVNQEIICSNCGVKHSHELLATLQAYDMLCPKCKLGTCKLVNLSRKYETLIRDVNKENLLPQTELGILKTLHDERREMFAMEIAAELDCSYQLIGKRGKYLAERRLVTRETNAQNRRVFEIGKMAQDVYFESNAEDEMNFGESVDDTGGQPL
jgi:hypothetical protein